MARLSEYMSQMAALLGHDKSVHFNELKNGSAQLCARVDHEDIPKVESRLKDTREGEGPKDAVKAIKEIDRMLTNDNTSGYIFRG